MKREKAAAGLNGLGICQDCPALVLEKESTLPVEIGSDAYFSAKCSKTGQLCWQVRRSLIYCETRKKLHKKVKKTRLKKIVEIFRQNTWQLLEDQL